MFQHPPHWLVITVPETFHQQQQHQQQQHQQQQHQEPVIKAPSNKQLNIRQRVRAFGQPRSSRSKQQNSEPSSEWKKVSAKEALIRITTLFTSTIRHLATTEIFFIDEIWQW